MTFACDGRLFPRIKEDITMMLFNGFCGGGTGDIFLVCAIELLSLLLQHIDIWVPCTVQLNPLSALHQLLHALE